MLLRVWKLVPLLALGPLLLAQQPQPAAWLDPDRSEPAGTRYGSLYSEKAGTEVSYLIYLPPGYESSGLRYPAIYWLHGLNGTQRSGAYFAEMLEEAIQAGQSPPMIVVFVNGMRASMYCDSRDGSRPVASVIVHDLIPHIDRTYRTEARRETRAVAGFSMGGFGAAHLGFKYPEMFGAVAVAAGAMHSEDTIAERRRAIFESVFGGDKEYFRANSPWLLVEKKAGMIRGRTFVQVGVGEEDGLLEWNREFSGLLKRHDIEHEFLLAPGVGHQGALYYRTLGPEKIFGFFARAFAGYSRAVAAPAWAECMAARQPAETPATREFLIRWAGPERKIHESFPHEPHPGDELPGNGPAHAKACADAGKGGGSGLRAGPGARWDSASHTILPAVLSLHGRCGSCGGRAQVRRRGRVSWGRPAQRLA